MEKYAVFGSANSCSRLSTSSSSNRLNSSRPNLSKGTLRTRSATSSSRCTQISPGEDESGSPQSESMVRPAKKGPCCEFCVVRFASEPLDVIHHSGLKPTLISQRVCPGHLLVAHPKHEDAIPGGACKGGNRCSENSPAHDGEIEVGGSPIH